MRRYPWAVAGLAAVLTACSSGGGGQATSTPTTTPAPSSSPQASTPAANPIGVSPGGVTTRIDVPAESTEEQYGQSCLAAKAWMESKGGDPASLVEPLLKEMQAGTVSGRATFNSTWAQLSDPQRAAVIIAVRAAAEGGC
ncbi:lipoprotein LpqV [Mycolicibacterium sp. CBM1]